MTVEDLLNEVAENVEYLQTTEGDEVPCISIENLEGILSRHLNITIKIEH